MEKQIDSFDLKSKDNQIRKHKKEPDPFIRHMINQA